MARTTISIPDDLYRRIQARKGQVNVSKVAQDAICDLLDRLDRDDLMRLLAG